MGPRTLRDIRKRLVRLTGQSRVDVDMLLDYVDQLEDFLTSVDEDDIFGTEGWRHAVGAED